MLQRTGPDQRPHRVVRHDTSMRLSATAVEPCAGSAPGLRRRYPSGGCRPFCHPCAVTKVIAALGDRDLAYLTHREIDARSRSLRATWRSAGCRAKALGSTDSTLSGSCPGRRTATMTRALPRSASRASTACRSSAPAEASSTWRSSSPATRQPSRRRLTRRPTRRRRSWSGGSRAASSARSAPSRRWRARGSPRSAASLRSPASTGAATAWCRAIERCRPGLVVSAHADDAGVEAFELPAHAFYLATLFQPQVGSSTRDSLHPVLEALVAATRAG